MPLVDRRVVPSEKVPVAVNCCVVPLANAIGLAGVIAIDTSVALLTVTLKLFVTPFTCTVIVLLPGPTPDTTPVELTVATAAFDEL